MTEMHSTDSSIKCGICGQNHFYKNCSYVSITSHVSDNELPSRARLSLPDGLELRKLVDGSSCIYAKTDIDIGTEFGPVEARRVLTIDPSIVFPVKVFVKSQVDFSEYYLDTCSENDCNWMMFVNPANNVEEQNLVCYQNDENIYFATTKDVKVGEALKVWYSPFYASKMGKNMLHFKDMEVPVSENTRDINLSELIRNQQKIVSRSVWNCKFCYKLEKDIPTFASHLIAHYSSQIRKMCEICKQTFSTRKGYRKHLKAFHDLRYKDERNANKDKIKNVVDFVSNRQIIKKTSPLEGKDTSFGGPLLHYNMTDSLDNSNILLQKSESNYATDINSIDNNDILVGSENLNLSLDCVFNQNVRDLECYNTEDVEPTQEQFICDVCLKPFKSLRSIIEHLKFHTGEFFCKECMKVFSRSENLKLHECLRQPTIKCKLCESIFYQKKYFTQHMDVIHNKKFLCKECKLSYSSAKELGMHACKQISNENRKKFKCSKCSKNFEKEVYLKKHMQFHDSNKLKNADRPVCSVCGITFKSVKLYKRHLKTHQAPTFECNICDKNFTRRDILKEHMRHIHLLSEKHKCDLCRKVFRSKKLLKNHLKTHSTGTYSCTICGVIFKQKSSLNRHTRLCHNKKDTFAELDKLRIFECPICNNKVKLKRSLQRHMKRTHPEEFRIIQMEQLKTSEVKLSSKLTNSVKLTDTDQKCKELKETIENMNFSIDINVCENIDNIFGETETIDSFLKERSANIIDSLPNDLLDSSISEQLIANRDSITLEKIVNKEVCLSMPDLDEGVQEAKLQKNLYGLENTSDVVLYVLNENK